MPKRWIPATADRGGSLHAAQVCICLSFLLWTSPCAAQAGAEPPALPSFAELEAAGFRIGEIRVLTNDVFDLNNPKEDKWLFRLANSLHIQTRAGVIRRGLLFKSGDPLTVQKLDETERFLRGQRYIYDVHIRAVAVRGDVVDLEVTTRDTWTLDAGASFSRMGGTNNSSIYLEDRNLLGTGITVGIDRSSNIDRTGTKFFLAEHQLLGSRVALDYDRSRNSDGLREAISLQRPFYSLDTRWSAGMSANRETRTDSTFQAGILDQQHQIEARSIRAFGGWSAGLVDGRVQRYTLGLSRQEGRSSNETGVFLSSTSKLVGPFARYELLEDRFEKMSNRNLLERPEYFALGLAATVQVDRSEPSLGANVTGWLYSGQISRGFELSGRRLMLVSGSLAGAYLDGRATPQTMGTTLSYYHPQAYPWLFFASGAYHRLSHGGPADTLLLGGDNGLRGYPLRYQTGQQRALLTLEERFFKEWFVWRLFRVGGAFFVDTGRAWGGETINRANPGWLSDVGFGLRIVSVRSSFGSVLHLDLAYPLNATKDIAKVQFLVKSKNTF